MIINNIQYFSLHDGPGIRTTIFVQGCNLNCAWCQNPETMSKTPMVCYESEKCINCGACATVCINNAHKFKGGVHIFDSSRCISCQKCVDACIPNAMKKIGNEIDRKELVKKLERDIRLYELSGGGVTISGGEPLLISSEISNLCQMLKQMKIHVAIDTTLNVPWVNIEKCIGFADLFLVDLKIINSDEHYKFTSVYNELILDNIKRLSETAQIQIRIPIIGGVNDSVENIENSAKFISSLGGNVVVSELLQYHDFGVEKAKKCGMKQDKFPIPSMNQMNALLNVLDKYKLNARIG